MESIKVEIRENIACSKQAGESAGEGMCHCKDGVDIRECPGTRGIIAELKGLGWEARTG